MTRCADIKFQRESAGALNIWGWENCRFSTDITVYFGNGAGYAGSYYGTLIGSHGRRIEWYYFRWPWVTPNPGFKVTETIRESGLTIIELELELTSRISEKRCVLGTKLLKNTNRKPYTICRIIPLSMTLSDLWHPFFNTNRKLYPVYRMVPLSITLSYLWPRFQCHDIFRHWVSQKRHEIEP